MKCLGDGAKQLPRKSMSICDEATLICDKPMSIYDKAMLGNDKVMLSCPEARLVCGKAMPVCGKPIWIRGQASPLREGPMCVGHKARSLCARAKPPGDGNDCLR